MKKLTIQSLDKKMAETKYGTKEKYFINFTENKDVIVNSFKGQWNEGWKEGDVIEVEDSQWGKQWEYEGRKYIYLKAPESARGNFSGFDELKKQYDALEARVSKLEGNNLKEDTKDISDEEFKKF